MVGTAQGHSWWSIAFAVVFDLDRGNADGSQCSDKDWFGDPQTFAVPGKPLLIDFHVREFAHGISFFAFGPPVRPVACQKPVRG